MVGLIAAFLPEVWLGLFSSDEEVIRVGTRYLQIAGPVYGFYGFGDWRCIPPCRDLEACC